MPIYEYLREDGEVIEIIQKVSDQELTECPNTGQSMKRLMSRSAFHLKGNGWYKTDYASSSKSSSDSGSKPSAAVATEKKEKSADAAPGSGGCCSGGGCGCH